MNSQGGVFLESLFGVFAIVFIILENNMFGAILCFIMIMLIDSTWEW